MLFDVLWCQPHVNVKLNFWTRTRTDETSKAPLKSVRMLILPVEMARWRMSDLSTTSDFGLEMRKSKSKLVCQCGAAFRRFGILERISRNNDASSWTEFKCYRWLAWDKPSSTITMNSGVISSDMKGHPDQNRVLSVREILMLSTLQNHPAASYEWGEKYEFKSKKAGDGWFHDGEMSPKLVRQVIGANSIRNHSQWQRLSLT